MADSMILYKCKDNMKSYWQENGQDVSMGTSWDAFKPVRIMRGSYMLGVRELRETNDSNLATLSQKASDLEAKYVSDLSNSTYQHWKHAERSYSIALANKAHK